MQYQREMVELDMYLKGDTSTLPEVGVEEEYEMDEEALVAANGIAPQAADANMNKILFLENLPLDTTKETLTFLFKEYRLWTTF
jgi:hypothetical protein